MFIFLFFIKNYNIYFFFNLYFFDYFYYFHGDGIIFYMYINIILNSTAAAVQLYNTIPQSNRHDGMTAKYRGCCRKWTLRVVDSQ